MCDEERCTACFLECEPSRRIPHYPCSDALRLWARAHRDDPPGLVVKEPISVPKVKPLCRERIRHRTPEEKAELLATISKMWAEGCTSEEIGDAVGIGATTVRMIATQNRDLCPRRYGSYTKEQRDECVRMRRDGMSYGEISRATGVKVNTVALWVRRAGEGG